MNERGSKRKWRREGGVRENERESDALLPHAFLFLCSCVCVRERERERAKGEGNIYIYI